VASETEMAGDGFKLSAGPPPVEDYARACRSA